MVIKCCVLRCRGNYDPENKVSVFSFPQDENMRRKWTRAIPRENLVVTKNTKVCIRHFKEADIVRDIEFFDRNGEKISYSADRVRLRKEAVPCIFLNCPKYLSNPENTRKSVEERQTRLENSMLKQAIDKVSKI